MNGQRIKHLREIKEYTQDYVANQLGVSRSTYANWETGNIILPLEKADKLSLLYETPLSYVLGLGTIHTIPDKIKPINYDLMIKKLNGLKNVNDNSFEEISKYIDTNRSTTNRYFKGTVSIPTDKLILLCEFYNISIDELSGK